MKFYLLPVLLASSLTVYSQIITSFYDHKSIAPTLDIVAMVGTSDSLYGVMANGGDNGWGAFVRWSKDGGEFDIIHSFDELNNNPVSLVGNDTVIYGTTRNSGSGRLFKYSLVSYQFEFLHEFSLMEAQYPEIKYITDSLLWGFTEFSSEDEGNVFTIGLDGSSFTKIYNNSSESLGRQFGDIAIHDEYLFIACRTGGGIPYDPGDGLTGSGSVIRLDLSGNNYLKLIAGQDGNGTDPRSLCVFGDKLYVLFSRAGTDEYGRLGYTTFDGMETDIGLVVPNPVGKLLIQDGILLINTTSELMVHDPITTGSRTAIYYQETEWSQSFTGPFKFDAGAMISFNGGGSETNGGLATFTNDFPTLGKSLNILLQEGFESHQLNLSDGYFIDDSYIVSIDFETVNGPSAEIVYNNANVEITIAELALGLSTGTLFATDNGLLTLETALTVFVNAPVEVSQEFQDTLVQEGFETLSFTLTEYFADRNLDELNFSASSSDESVVTVSISGNELLISNIAQGTSEIMVSASDSHEGDTTVSFTVFNNGSPTGEIDNVLLTEGFETTTIDLNEIISDPNEDALDYEVEVVDGSVIEAEILSGLLIITELGSGLTTVNVTTTDGKGGILVSSFEFEINLKPVLDGTIEIISVIQGFGTASIDFSDKFLDPDGDELSFSLENSNTDAIDANIDGTTVTIDEKAFGVGTVVLNISDGRGGVLEVTLLDLILGADNSYKDLVQIYPNPVTSTLTIKQTLNFKQARIIGLDGQIVLKVDIQQSQVIDISHLRSGIYLLQLMSNKDSHTFSQKILVK
ncbi:MAG: T9SS type A sorting domain-containing protein [Bacteroidota bacterium]